MRTPSSIGSHPVHALSVTIPVGLFVFSYVCDLIAFFSDTPETWLTVALYTMVGGFISALFTAIPGIVDFMAMTNSQLKRIALLHLVLNVCWLTLYAINLWMRFHPTEHPGNEPILLSTLAIVLLGISGWFGAEMVHKYGVGVDGAGSKL